MTDTTDPIAPAASEPAATVEPAETAVDYSVHPAWSKAVEAIPEVLRAPLYEAIRTSETETQKAIEKARTETVPAEWLELYNEANEMGLGVEQIAGAYVSQAQLMDMLSADPDAFVATLQTQVDQLVASGQITRKAGAQAMQQAEALADEQTDDLLTPAEKELKARVEAMEAERATERQTAAQAQAQADADAAQVQEAEAFFRVFDSEMQTAGLMQANEQGVLVSTIPVETLQLIAEAAGRVYDANPRMTPQQAIQQAHASVRRQIEAVGGKLGPAAAAITPVIGGSSAMPGGVVKSDTPRTMEDRENAALAELRRMQAE